MSTSGGPAYRPIESRPEADEIADVQAEIAQLETEDARLQTEIARLQTEDDAAAATDEQAPVQVVGRDASAAPEAPAARPTSVPHTDSDDAGDDVYAPNWFEYEPFTTLCGSTPGSKRIRHTIYVLFTLAPVLTSAGSMMEVVHGCPTISVPIELFFAGAMFSFSGVWVFLFYSLCKVARGAHENLEKCPMSADPLMRADSGRTPKERLRLSMTVSYAASKFKTASKQPGMVDDRATDALVDQFYHRYLENLGVSECADSAQGNIPASKDPEDASATEVDPLARVSTQTLGDQNEERNCCGYYLIEKDPPEEGNKRGPFQILAFQPLSKDGGISRVKITRPRCVSSPIAC